VNKSFKEDSLFKKKPLKAFTLEASNESKDVCGFKAVKQRVITNILHPSKE